MSKKFPFIFLVILPILFLFIGLKFDRTKYGTDPESAYLLNGVNIATGKAVGHFDNPGTTVQIYSAIVLRITHVFRSTTNDLQTDVLLNSEYYIEILRKVLIALNAILLLVLGVVAFVLLGNIWFGLILQIAPFMSSTLIEECFTKVAPEPILFSTVAVLIMLLIKYYTSKEQVGKKYAMFFGILSGFGLATKLTFLPVLILPFLILEGKRLKWIYVVSIVPAFILFTLPAAKGYLYMAKWFLNLGTHTGTYGQGNAGIIDPAVYLKALIEIAKNNVSMVVILLIAILTLIVATLWVRKQKSSMHQKEFNVLLALVIVLIGSILMVAKHYHSNHYLFPSLSMTGIVVIFIYLLISKYFKTATSQIAKLSLPFITLLLCGASILNIPTLSMAYEGYRLSNKSTDDTNIRLERDYKDFVKAYYYPTSFNVYSSLRWGNVYSRQYSLDKLMQLYPEGLFYNAWDKCFQIWETKISVDDLIRQYGGRILLVGGPKTDEEHTLVEQGGLALNKIFDSRVQAVYEIDTANSELFMSRLKVLSSRMWSNTCDFEMFSDDKQWFLGSNGQLLCRTTELTAEKSKSGKHAIKVSGADSYGMEYWLKNIKGGDKYRLSVWYSGDTKNVFLVAAAASNNLFYAQIDGGLIKDKKGWAKLELDINIPAGFDDNKLKIYLWNHSANPAWFDNFEIVKY